MKATIIQTISDGKPDWHICEIGGYDVNNPNAESELAILKEVFARHSEQIKDDISEAFAELSQSEQPEDDKPKADQSAAMVLNLSCPWLDTHIRTGIYSPTAGKEYILSDYYVDKDGNRHFTNEQALEIGANTLGWKLCTDEFHNDLTKALWDAENGKWKENVCNTLLNGYEYMTKVLKYELGGYRYRETGVLAYVGYEGSVWSSSVSGSSGFYLRFSTQGLGPSYANYRGHGFQVRCLQE